jgi:hypothetical protein
VTGVSLRLSGTSEAALGPGSYYYSRRLKCLSEGFSNGSYLMGRNNWSGPTPSASAIFATTLTVGLRTPRSTPLTVSAHWVRFRAGARRNDQVR